jgi:hypothetical protein
MNPQNGQTSLDYLNQITPQAPKKPVFVLNLRTVIIGGLIVLVLIIILANVGSSMVNARKEPWQRLSARLAATAVIVDGSTAKIKNSQLRSLNSDLKLYITNTQRSMADPLKALDISAAKLPASITASESSVKMAQRLEDGRLNAKYDSTYAREMTYQLANLLAVLKQIYASNISAQTKTTVEGWYNNLLPTYTTVSEFSASNE